MGFPSDQLTKWVALQYADITDAGPAKRFELYHAVEDQAPERLHVFERSDDDSAGILAQRIWDVAETDAANRLGGTPERYTVAMWRAEGEDFESQTSFILQHRSRDILGMSTEPPNEKGVAGQTMRHLELLVGPLLREISDQRAQAARQNREQADRLAGYETRMMQMLEKEQELLDRSQDRKLAEARELATERRHEKLMGSVLTMGMAVFAQFMGTHGGKAGAEVAKDDATGKLFETLDEQDFMRILGVLTPPKQVALIEVLKSYKQKYDARQAETPAALRDQTEEPAPEEVH